MEQLPYDEIIIAYDDDSQSYYCIWRPLTSVGLGKTKAEALDDLRVAAPSPHANLTFVQSRSVIGYATYLAVDSNFLKE